MEKWHWSYLPLAKPLTEMAKEQLKNENISGFNGADSGQRKIDVVQKYVLGIHPRLSVNFRRRMFVLLKKPTFNHGT
jgi:hypothetical protein